MSELAC